MTISIEAISTNLEMREPESGLRKVNPVSHTLNMPVRGVSRLSSTLSGSDTATDVLVQRSSDFHLQARYSTLVVEMDLSQGQSVI